jgi:hypothetical protein
MSCRAQSQSQGEGEESDNERQAQERHGIDSVEPPEISFPYYDSHFSEGRGIAHHTSMSEQNDIVADPQSNTELENRDNNGESGSHIHLHIQGQGMYPSGMRAGAAPPTFESTSSTESSSSSTGVNNDVHASRRLRKKQEEKTRRFESNVEAGSNESQAGSRSTANAIPENIQGLTRDPTNHQSNVARTASYEDGDAPLTHQQPNIAEINGSGNDQQIGMEDDEERAIRESLQSYYSESGLPLNEDVAPQVMRPPQTAPSQSTIRSSFPQPSQATDLAQLNQQLQQAQVSHSHHDGIEDEIDPLPTAVALPVHQEEEEDHYNQRREDESSESDENIQYFNESAAALRPIFAAVPATPVPERQTWHSVLRNRRVLALLAVFVTVVLVAITVIAVFVPQSLENQREMNLSLEQKVRLESFTNTLAPVSGRAALEDPYSAQYRALQWIAFEDGSRVEPSKRTWLIQRFALAVLYFSTNGQSTWLEPHNWLAPDHECSWKSVSKIDGKERGVTACTVLRVTKLRLGKCLRVAYIGIIGAGASVHVVRNAIDVAVLNPGLLSIHFYCRREQFDRIVSKRSGMAARSQ